MKKFLYLFMVVVFLFTMSCSNEDVIPQTETIKETPIKDMQGYEFIFKAMTDYETFFFPAPIESERGDKILARYSEAGERFNCIVNVSVVEGTLQSQLVAAAAVSDKYTDLIDTGARTIYENLDYFLPLSNIPGFNLEENKWGPQNYLETTKFNGENYGFIAYAWGIPYPQYIGNLYFMPSIIKEFGLVNPQELYEQKTWTWDKFKEYATAMTVKGSTKDEDRYGFVVSDAMQFPRAMIISNGGNAIVFDNALNKYVYGLNDSMAQQALQFIKDMLDKGIGYYTVADEWAISAQMFKDRRLGFYEAFNKHSFVNAPLHLASDLGEPYGWVPYPCGPSGTYGVSTAQFWWTARFLGVVDNFLDDDEMENNSILLNYIFSPLESETEESWKDLVKRRFFFDDLSFKYYIDLFEGGTTDFSAVAFNSAWTNIPNVYRQIFKGTKSVSESVLSVAEKVNTELDELVNPYMEANK